MIVVEELQGKHAELSIDRPDALRKIAHALSSPVRISIMRALGQRSMSVGELAEALDIPMSTTALAVKTLEEAGIITSETQPGARGSMKLCSRRLDTVAIALSPEQEKSTSTLTMRMPIGGYSVAEGIKPTCGLADQTACIGQMDDPATFYVTDRFAAQLLWFRQGALEYRFSFPAREAMIYDWLEVSFEACSEAPMYRNPWKSDIRVSVNGKTLGVWTCPCDCGGRHGKLTPAWWSELSTQFGFLKTWRVDNDGSYLDGAPIGGTTLRDLGIERQSYIAVRIEVAADAENVGGINLFGESFGDYAQPIVLRVGYHMHGGEEDGADRPDEAEA